MRVLVIVLLVLTVLLLTPLGIDGGYNGKSLILGIRAGFLNIKILPKKKKHTEPKLSKIQKPPKPSRKKKQENEKPKKTFDKKELIELAKLGLKGLGRLRRKLHVNHLRIHYTFASNDPFDTAMGFGASCAAVGAVIPLVESAFDIGERDVGTSFDFLSDKPVFDCWITMTIQLWELFYVAIALGIDYLIFKHKQKREDHK